jgi:anti-sigma-K factor RskA
MTGQVLRFDAAAHKVVDALLPWYVNGTLKGDELEGVERHLRDCALCRQEVDWLRELYEACATADSAPETSNAFRNLRRRLEDRSVGSRAVMAPTSSRTVWTRWAIAASLVVAVVFGASLLRDTSAPALYRTLGAARAAEPVGSMIVVFDPATTEADLRRILRQADARLIDGPTQSNAYVLSIPAEQQQNAMRVLRAERAVVLVERLGPEKSP